MLSRRHADRHITDDEAILGLHKLYEGSIIERAILTTVAGGYEIEAVQKGARQRASAAEQLSAHKS